MEQMIKSFLRGFLVGIGFILALYLCSKITLFGINGSIKEFSTSIGEMFINFGK